MSNDVSFVKGARYKFPETLDDGTFYIATDEKRMYLDGGSIITENAHNRVLTLEDESDSSINYPSEFAVTDYVQRKFSNSSAIYTKDLFDDMILNTKLQFEYDENMNILYITGQHNQLSYNEENQTLNITL